MSSSIYRCSRCRTRNQFRRRITEYIIPRKCRDCGHTHFYVDKERVRRKPCRCGGYHYAHRPGSRCCELHTDFVIHRLMRAGASEEEIADVRLDLALEGRGEVVAECPF